jgi:hypothetical protein
VFATRALADARKKLHTASDYGRKRRFQEVFGTPLFWRWLAAMASISYLKDILKYGDHLIITRHKSKAAALADREFWARQGCAVGLLHPGDGDNAWTVTVHFDQEKTNGTRIRG